ncbi:conserved hypothetical protein [Candidatus Sulfopaludibacter sp. SbA4]|nr:conserved hypothetical protein [Candidatus Sulfopaludibacter sp. SbA4]
MRVQLYYFDGCPNHLPALERLRQILRQEGLTEHVEEINVTSPEQAQALAFLGSPTIKLNGVDVEPAARDSQAYAMACRTYRNGAKQEGLPPEEMIRAALREASGQPAGGHDCRTQTVPAVAAKSRESKSASVVMAGSMLAAILASFCCILPIVFGLTGLTVVGASAAFAVWRPYLLTATFGLLAAGFYFAYRPAETECASGSALRVPPSRNRMRFGKRLFHARYQATWSSCSMADHGGSRGLCAVSVLLGAGRGISAPGQDVSRRIARPAARFIPH